MAVADFVGKRKYENPPIEEALCAFNFKPHNEWDLAAPGLIYEQLKDVFPVRRAVQPIVSFSPANISINMAVSGDNPFSIMPHSSDTIRFEAKDGLSYVQLAPFSLSIHRVKPYSTWEDFLPLIEKSLSAYSSNATSLSFERVGLRYINVLQIPGREIDMEKYFEFRPHMGPMLDRVHGPFIVGTEFPFPDTETTLRLQLSSVATTTVDDLAFLLDLDYYTLTKKIPPPGAIRGWLIEAHTQISRFFELSITDEVRNTFDKRDK